MYTLLLKGRWHRVRESAASATRAACPASEIAALLEVLVEGGVDIVGISRSPSPADKPTAGSNFGAWKMACPKCEAAPYPGFYSLLRKAEQLVEQ